MRSKAIVAMAPRASFQSSPSTRPSRAIIAAMASNTAAISESGSRPMMTGMRANMSSAYRYRVGGNVVGIEGLARAHRVASAASTRRARLACCRGQAPLAVVS